jgi:hypothetical protein
MIKHDVDQKSYEWFQLRRGKVTGTTSKGLFVKSETLLNDLISQLTEDFDDEEGYVSFDMQRGIDLEPIAREELGREVFISFKEIGLLQNSSIKILAISPDGINEDGTIQCEIKCPSSKKHTQTIRQDEIPSDNIHQVLHAFVVNEKLEKLIFCSYRPENNICPLWYKVVTRETEIDLGTKAKPNIKTVQEWVDIALTEAELLDAQVDAELKRLEEKYCQ